MNIETNLPPKEDRMKIWGKLKEFGQTFTSLPGKIVGFLQSDWERTVKDTERLSNFLEEDWKRTVRDWQWLKLKFESGYTKWQNSKAVKFYAGLQERVGVAYISLGTIVLLAFAVSCLKALVFQKPHKVINIEAENLKWFLVITSMVLVVFWLWRKGINPFKTVFSWTKERLSKVDDLTKWPAIVVAGVLVSNALFWVLFPDVWEAWFKEPRWFWSVNIGLLVISAFLANRTLAAIIIALVLSVLLFNGSVFYAAKKLAVEEEKKEQIRNRVGRPFYVTAAPAGEEKKNWGKKVYIPPEACKGNGQWGFDARPHLVGVLIDGREVYEAQTGDELGRKRARYVQFQALGEQPVSVRMYVEVDGS